jgi:sortase A
MNPDTSSPGGDVPIKPEPGASPHPSTPSNHQQAAANVLRGQIDALYGGEATPAAQSPATESIYHRTHQQHVEPQADQWKAYHSAWQNYYQQYYENYYQHAKAPKEEPQATSGSHYFSQQPTDLQQTEDALTNDQALYELRQKLLGRVQSSAKRIRKSRHFIPIVAALVVVLLFVFVQYNRVFIANVQAYVSPGSIDPQNIVVDPTADIVVSKESRLIIPKINVDVPVLYDVGTDYDSQMKAMEKGVAHFPIPGANSHPGERGNTVLSGHSSNDLFDPGNYKFIFAQLEKLSKGDTIYANYKGKRYTYVITKTEVVKPTEVNKLIYPTDKPVMTLITCTPLGTALNRLLVTAEQVSPDPTAADKAPQGSGEPSGEDDSIPGNSPTFLERLFGL